MKIKSFVVAIAAIISVATISSASAQNNNEWKIGGKMNIYTRWDGAVGVGVYARYAFADKFRVEPSFVYICRKGMSVDISADVHYPINVGENLELYPLAGLSLNDPGRLGLGVNFGGGASYNLSNDLSIDAGLKWSILTQDFIKNPVIISIGASYRFNSSKVSSTRAQ